MSMENTIPFTDAEQKWEFEYMCNSVASKNHWLLYGRPKNTVQLLRKVYEAASTWDWASCTWHDASAISCPMDFFGPVLGKKYGAAYDEIAHAKWFQEAVRQEDYLCLAGLCASDERSQSPDERKTPIIFVDGIEQLLFKFDYGHVAEADRGNIVRDRNIMHKYFGNCLRGSLHQTGQGVINGTVRNPAGIEFAATLGNYDYLFYSGNFWPHIVRADKDFTWKPWRPSRTSSK